MVELFGYLKLLFVFISVPRKKKAQNYSVNPVEAATEGNFIQEHLNYSSQVSSESWFVHIYF